MTKQIQNAIRATGLPLLEIARRAGVSQPQISRFMGDERTLTLPVVEKLCKSLGLKLQLVNTSKSKRKK